MRLLAIDTALAACSAAVYDTHGGVLASESIPMERGHAEALMPLIGRVMNAAGIKFDALDRVAVTVGPGSFTGLRVGVAAARGIALAAGKPAVGVTTLAAFAAPLLDADDTTPVMSAIDARHRQIYMQIFWSSRPMIAARLTAVEDAIRSVAHGPIRLAGNGAKLVASVWPEDGATPTVDFSSAPDILWVARLGVNAEAESAPPKPFYLRSPDARPQEGAAIPRR